MILFARSGFAEQVARAARGRSRRSGSATAVVRQGLEQAAELVQLVEGPQLLDVARMPGQRPQVGQPLHMVAQVAIGLDGYQLAADRQPVQRLAQVLAHHALDAGGFLHQLVERAVGVEPLGSGLGADLVHAGYVVHRIAHQRLIIDHQRGRHPELGRDARHVALLAIHGVDDGDMRVHQLAKVLVATRNDHALALLCSHAGQGADDVVRFHALDAQHMPAEQAHHLVDRLYLAGQILRHGRTMALVVRIQLVAEGAALGIEHADGVARGKLAFERLHHVDQDAQGSGGLAGAVGQGHAPVAAGVEGAVQVAGTIHQQQGVGRGIHGGRFFGHGRIGNLFLHRPAIVPAKPGAAIRHSPPAVPLRLGKCSLMP